MEKLIIFGNGFCAEVVAKIVLESNNFEIICFTVDKKYIKKKKIFGPGAQSGVTLKKKNIPAPKKPGGTQKKKKKHFAFWCQKHGKT